MSYVDEHEPPCSDNSGAAMSDNNTPEQADMNQPEEKMLSSYDRAMIAARTADDNRAQDIVILDLRELTPHFDFFVICSGTSRRQLHAISEEIDHAFEDGLGDKRLSIEGYDESRWIVLDYGDVMIHIFEPETRAYYALEELWGKGERVEFESRQRGEAF